MEFPLTEVPLYVCLVCFFAYVGSTWKHPQCCYGNFQWSISNSLRAGDMAQSPPPHLRGQTSSSRCQLQVLPLESQGISPRTAGTTSMEELTLSKCTISRWDIVFMTFYNFSFLSSVPEFEASKYLITNREFLAFVQDSGYQRKDLWTQEGH